MTLRSAQFDDIYFSPEDGLAESRHVFVHSNNLPDSWKGRDLFTIGETGFGTGLNFLAAWTLFDQTASPSQRLHYVSFEKYPLDRGQILGALSLWRQEFGGRLDRLLAMYPLRVPGFHRLTLNEQVSLTLIFDDVNEALPQLEAPSGIDAWFLDGFAPAKNPQMWTDTVFGEMARLSRAGTTFATFTAAGAVKRGLAAAGFQVEKREGYGRKRDMLCGFFKGKEQTAGQVKNKTNRIALIGGGLAGTSAAFVLKRNGFQPVIFEAGASLASGASGNSRGLYNPRLSAQRTAESDFYTAAWAGAYSLFNELQGHADIAFDPCGSLHLATSEDRARKFSGAVENWGWPEAHLLHLKAEDAGHYAGLSVHASALYLPEAGTVNPSALCHTYARDVDVRLATPVTLLEQAGNWRVNGENFDAVIMCCAGSLKLHKSTQDMPVHTVRGQITEVKAIPETEKLRVNLCFGGYFTPAVNGAHMLGASFQKWLEDTAARPEDDRDNIERLRKVLPFVEDLPVMGSRAALRTSSRDRFPLIGAVQDVEGLYISTAHGSHGLVSTLAGAKLIVDMIMAAPLSLPRATSVRLGPARFLLKEQGRVL